MAQAQVVDKKSSTECKPATGTKSDDDAGTPQTDNDTKSTTKPTNDTKEKQNAEDKDKDNDKDKAKIKEDDIILETISPGGIYSITREVRVRTKNFDLLNAPILFGEVYAGVKKRASLMPYGYRFFLECFNTAPLLMSMFLLVKLWGSLRSTLSLILTEKLMKIIQNGITSHKIDGKALLEVLFLRLLSIALESFVTSKSEQLRYVLRRKIRYVIMGRMLHTNLNFDLPAYEDSKYIEETNHYYPQYHWHDEVWDQFEKIVELCSNITGIFSQFSFLYYLLRTQPGGILFVIVSAIQPISQRNFFSGSRLAACAWDSNPFYRRVQTILRIILQSEYRLEIISLGLKDYISKEWADAVKGLGDISESLPAMHGGELSDESFLKSFRSNILSHLPMMFYSYQVYLNPKAFSLASIALVDQATMMIDQILENIFGARYSTKIDFDWMKSLYEGAPDSRVMEDGEIVYSSANDGSSNGMEIKFENVSFTYSKGKEPVLKDISFTIQKGQTVVIVGSNGSGKSTLLKLINRIYDVSSGTIHVDGKPLKSYVSSSVQYAMAILFQKFNHFPLSFAENIFLGCPNPPQAQVKSSEKDQSDNTYLTDPSHEKTLQAIKIAAELGGSMEIIDKESKGINTVLQPVVSTEFENYDVASQKFKDFVKEIYNRTVDMSLGQWQRLALARLFYRSGMKHIKLVAADEPSASLDPQIEYQIFGRLYSLSAELGKTLVYVTHRFGYLTRRADLILVMKDGKLVEQGRHSDLLALDGEYAKLYKVQAEAFLSDPKETTTPSTPERDSRPLSSSEE